MTKMTGITKGLMTGVTEIDETEIDMITRGTETEGKTPIDEILTGEKEIEALREIEVLREIALEEVIMSQDLKMNQEHPSNSFLYLY